MNYVSEVKINFNGDYFLEMIFRYLGVILSKIWVLPNYRTLEILEHPCMLLEVQCHGVWPKTLFMQPALSHYWEYLPVLVNFFSCPFGSIPTGLKDQKHGSSHSYLVQGWFCDCAHTLFHAISSMSVLWLILSSVRAIKGPATKMTRREKSLLKGHK